MQRSATFSIELSTKAFANEKTSQITVEPILFNFEEILPAGNERVGRVGHIVSGEQAEDLDPFG